MPTPEHAAGMGQETFSGRTATESKMEGTHDVNEPDLNMLKKICFLFGVNMDDFAKEVITKMETYEKKEKRQFNKYDMAIGLFYGVGIFLGIGIFFVGGFMTMSGAGWGASLFGGGCFSLVFGLICHAVITLRRNDK
ncbi:XRE family transcriptional regulator [Trueperella pyogenes]|uniref:XRE family transcriptional regulator n=1 Tax=Trueperella pyogenes TaxID=1661 RepID=UPI001FD7537D|nr:XRE family transcriptional regulator [Trueperella pyogenes]